jgi:hypothetical protein
MLILLTERLQNHWKVSTWNILLAISKGFRGILLHIKVATLESVMNN